MINEIELSHSMVHYLLTIHKLKEERGFARATDIAKDLGLTKGTVSSMLTSLKKKNFINEEIDSKFVILTTEGHDEVHRILSSRTLLYYFLRDFVGVDDETAKKDSCQMEHLMSAETGAKFFQFMKNLACEKDPAKKMHFKTSLDICSYETVHDFVHEQKGDAHL